MLSLPKLETLIKSGAQLLAVLTAIVSGYYWLADKTRAYAGDFIAQEIAPPLAEQSAKIDALTKQIEALAQSLAAQSQIIRSRNWAQSQADLVNKKAACYLKLQADPSSGSVEECEAIQ